MVRQRAILWDVDLLGLPGSLAAGRSVVGGGLLVPGVTCGVAVLPRSARAPQTCFLVLSFRPSVALLISFPSSAGSWLASAGACLGLWLDPLLAAPSVLPRAF